jgi:hypothetical protein
VLCPLYSSAEEDTRVLFERKAAQGANTTHTLTGNGRRSLGAVYLTLVRATDLGERTREPATYPYVGTHKSISRKPSLSAGTLDSHTQTLSPSFFITTLT